MQPRLPISLLAGLILAFPVFSVAETWHTVGGQTVEGQLADVYGTVAFIAGKKYTSLVPIDTMTDAELQRVAAFATAKSATTPTWATSTAKVTKALRKNLKTLRDGKMAVYDPSAQREPDIYLFYYSAGWCGPCHRFTPDLTKAYQRLKAEMPGKFEVIFISSNESSYEQAEYARKFAMPWPALSYSSVGNTPVVDRLAGTGIPCLVAVTREGDPIFHSYHGEEYVGPDSVLKDTEYLLRIMSDDTVQARAKRHRLAVLQHIESGTDKVLPPKPYLISFDPNRYRTIDTDSLNITLEIDENGLVKDSRIKPELPTVVRYMLQQEVATWLFLPAVDHGKGYAKTVELPLEIRRAPNAGAGT